MLLYDLLEQRHGFARTDPMTTLNQQTQHKLNVPSQDAHSGAGAKSLHCVTPQ